MAFSIAATSSTVAITGTVNFTSTPMLKATAVASGVTTTDIATITAGKTGSLIGFSLTAANGATPGSCFIKDSDGNIIVSLYLNATTVDSTALSFTTGSIGLAATKKFQVSTDSATITARATVHYLET